MRELLKNIFQKWDNPFGRKKDNAIYTLIPSSGYDILKIKASNTSGYKMVATINGVVIINYVSSKNQTTYSIFHETNKILFYLKAGLAPTFDLYANTMKIYDDIHVEKTTKYYSWTGLSGTIYIFNANHDLVHTDTMANKGISMYFEQDTNITIYVSGTIDKLSIDGTQVYP